MNFSADHIPVSSTGFFSSIVTDYLAGADRIKEFYRHSPDMKGIDAAIRERENFAFDRSLLVAELAKQYSTTAHSEAVQRNLELLGMENTFTVCAAHQPNIFTGHLYFVYKILHAIKLAEYLNGIYADKKFVPVYYMGSEDADLDELGSVEIDGQVYKWRTEQSGAVGRMKVDKQLLSLISDIAGRISVMPHGVDVVELLRSSYVEGRTIEESTFHLVNEMFGGYGLIVLLPDSRNFKRAFSHILRKEILEGFSAKAVAATTDRLSAHYKVQAGGREINLFYLKDDLRERIDLQGDAYKVNNSDISFTREEILEELRQFPERFSPNVILRPVFQEMILPNVAFIGGGGELAYWLELKEVFNLARVPMPVLLLRNSFLLITGRRNSLMKKWNLSPQDLFKGKQKLIADLVTSVSESRTDLHTEIEKLDEIFAAISGVAISQDRSLEKHVASIRQLVLSKVKGIEKKMLRAAMRREEALVNQVSNIYEALFPKNGLQERVENIIPYLANYGLGIFDVLLANSGSTEQDFTIIYGQ